MLKIPVAEPSIVGNEWKYLERCIDTKQISRGEFVAEFEEEFAKYCGTKYAISVSNGTCTLHLALLSYGVKAGDEVIVPDMTFVATSNAVHYTRAKPVFCDIDRSTWNIDTAMIENLISEKTKAIIPVHLYGLPCEMNEINEIAEKNRLVVIEDSAEAIGAEYKGRKVGSLGGSAIFSMYGNKTIVLGEGGMITTNDKEVAERARFLKEGAMSEKKRYYHTEIGYNYRLSNIQCAFGLAQLEKVEELVEKRIAVAKRYVNELDVKIQAVEPYMKHAYWMFGMLLESTREATLIQSRLESAGIETRPFFHPMSKMPFNVGAKNPVSLDVSRRGVCLPTFSGMTEEQAGKVIGEVNKVLG